MQAQDLPGARTSVALRTGARSQADVEAALQRGDVVRTSPMRGTLHLVAARDASWMTALMGPRGVAKAAGRHRQLGLDGETITRATRLAAAALEGGRPLRRAELWAAWEAGGVATADQRGVHLLMHLAQTGTVCLGPLDGTHQLVVLGSEWLPPAPHREPEQALGELARRYFGGHGPASEADLARWSGLRITDVRRGIALARPDLETLTVDGVEHLMDPETPARLRAALDADALLLLPGFDEYLLGYADRSAAVASHHAERIVPGANGMFRPTVVDRGRVVGTWRHAGRGAARTLETEPFDTFSPAVRAALPRAYAALP